MNGTAPRHIGPYIVAGLVTAFLIAIAYGVFFVPKLKESKVLAAQAVTAHQSNAVLSAKAAKISALAGNLGPLKSQVASFTGSFMTAAEQRDLIAAINEAGVSTGVTVTTLNTNAPVVVGDDSTEVAPVQPQTQEGTELPGPAPVNTGGGEVVEADSSAVLGTVHLKIDGDGTLDAVKAFIVKVETLTRPLTVNEVKIDQLDGRYHVSILGESFIAAELPAPDSGE